MYVCMYTSTYLNKYTVNAGKNKPEIIKITCATPRATVAPQLVLQMSVPGDNDLGNCF